MATTKCNFCGASIPADCTTCPKCGAPHEPEISTEVNVINDAASGWLKVLALLVPVYGIIAYFVTRDETPKKAKTLLNWGIAGFVISVICGLFI